MTDSDRRRSEGFVPVTRADNVVRSYGNEAVAWSAIAPEPVFLDPVAALVLQIVDGCATVGDLVEDVHDVLGVDPTVALEALNRTLGLFAAGGLLENAPPTTRPTDEHAPFRGPPSEQVLGRARLAELGSLDLSIAGRAVRVMCADDDLLAAVRAGLAGCVTSTKAPLGFVLQVPTTRTRLYVLTDRIGVVLGRTRDRDHALAMLAGHLDAFQPAPDGAMRLQARAVILSDGAAVLAPWPLLVAPPVSEHRFERIGCRVVDRLWVDVDPAAPALDLHPLPWEGSRPLDPGPGHVAAMSDPSSVRGLMLPDRSTTELPSSAQLVHHVASLVVGREDRAWVLDAAHALAGALSIRTVEADDADGLERHLRALVEDGAGRDESSSASSRRARSAPRTIEETYDELPYGSKAFVDSHPIQLSTTAEFRGLHTAPVERCRVLELGCGEGGNLVPVAEAYPDSEFVGIDLSSRQVEAGAAAIEQLGLSNVELLHRDISELDDSFGRFDYIICHGVYSWVPPEIQSRILDICRARATPRGVAYVSYNTYPGWHVRGLLRKAMLDGVDPDAGLVDAVAMAREVLTTMILDVDPDSSHGQLIALTAEAVLDDTDAYIAHEFLAPINEPLYHGEFVERAVAHGLRWLDDQRMTANPSLLGHRLISARSEHPRRQEYNDLLSNGSFRGAVLCRADAAIDVEQVRGRLRDFRASTSLAAPKRLDLAEGVPATFTGRDVRSNSMTLEAESAVLKAALKHLAGSIDPMRFAELVELVEADLLGGAGGQDVEAVLTKDLQALRAFHANEAVEFLSHPYRFTRSISSTPSVSGWARREATVGTTVTNRKNQQFDVSEPVRRFLVRRLDGTRSIADLVADAIRESSSGNLRIEKRNGRVLKPGTEDEATVRAIIEDRLAALARNAMLVS